MTLLDDWRDGPSPLLIDGKLVRADQSFATIDPATEETIGVASDATLAELDQAIAAARRAFDESRWAADLPLRVRCLRQLHDVLVRHGDELRDLTVREVGAPRFLTYGAQFDAPVADLLWFARRAEEYEWTRDLGRAAPMGMVSDRQVVREPVGVVGAVTPGNFPHQINLAKLGPALAAGNTVVLKPSPETPWCAAALGRLIAEETDLPPGVVNVVTGTDHALGARLAADPRVDLVSFTGSAETGRAVMRTAAESLKKVLLELGGKSAFIVLDDADLGSACSYAAFSGITHAGQGCAITTRLLVPRARHDEAVEITARTLAKIGVGDPGDDGTVCGPVISARQRDRVEEYLALAVEEGGAFATGGRRADREKGFWIEPTLVTGLTNASRTAREEIFGPVLVILPHDGDDDAVRIANDSPYGLSGAVHGGDLDRARAVARRLRTGTVGVNGGVWYSADVPFGGYKQSGVGREMGLAGFEEYLEIKSIAEGAG
ncbi:aldehyde dehydrogenase [Actinoallomurus sp. NPDC052308]|uniref:aldehyde dehydrogenase n=1 Tax=Actinoallomurus sp. NPDC052308 TaxID=3155530 RepID=UPI003414BF9F